MSAIKRWLTLALCAWVLIGCNLPAAEPTLAPTESPVPSAAAEPTAAPTKTATPTAVPLPVLDEAALRNGTYDLPLYEKRVTLVDGNYAAGEGAEKLSVVMLPQIARGDLDADGSEDAAVFIGENGGGSGTFVSLYAILNRDGQAFQAATVLIDDRPRINSLAILDGEIVVEGVIHGAEDVMAAPTLAVLETYRLDDSRLTLVRFASGLLDGVMHRIVIESPARGTEVTGSVNLRGSMPVGPFENNLRLRILDAAGTELYVGPFGVQSADIGVPATFDQTVDLSMVPAGTRITIELAELSMKDGSIMAMDTLELLRMGE